MNISEEKYSSLEKLFDSRTAEFRRKGNLLFKNYYFLTKEIKDNLEYLINKPYILGSGIPIDEFFINDSFKGVVINYFKDAVSFSKVNNFSIEEKIKACNDISRQLNELHDYGMCFNDIQCDNLLIDKDGGHLIDFDSATKRSPKKTESHYELTLNGRMLSPSYNTDKLKQALTNLSLIYKINFEEIINDRTNDINSLFSLFKDNKEIFNLLYSYLSCDNSKPYFDVLKDSLEDEEKIIFESAKIYRKTNNLV